MARKPGPLAHPQPVVEPFSTEKTVHIPDVLAESKEDFRMSEGRDTGFGLFLQRRC